MALAPVLPSNRETMPRGEIATLPTSLGIKPFLEGTSTSFSFYFSCQTGPFEQMLKKSGMTHETPSEAPLALTSPEQVQRFEGIKRMFEKFGMSHTTILFVTVRPGSGW